ncbi:MAG: tRNA adenosine(34) deaminase TadA [Candidatus Omnitrophica bacterium]|nr:tRNA adenosine(34) deaminase TadA [Candidatus Omnitrophota bacterium]
MDDFLVLERYYMQEALKQAKIAFEKDEVPVGAVITHQNQIIAKAHNQVETLNDPTAHAEMIAITQASNSLRSKWLYDCDMYVTLEPCSMCAGALVLARLKRVFFGATDPKTGACGSLYSIVQDPRLNHKVEIIPGILADECAALIRRFFQQKRSFENLN